MPGLSQDGRLTLVHITQRRVIQVPLQRTETIIAIILNTFCQHSTNAYIEKQFQQNRH